MNEAIQMGLFLDKSTSIEMWKDNLLWGWTCCQPRWDHCSFHSREERPRSRVSCRWRGFSVRKWNGNRRWYSVAPWGKHYPYLSWAIGLRHCVGLGLCTCILLLYNVVRIPRTSHTLNHASVVFLICFPWGVVLLWCPPPALWFSNKVDNSFEWCSGFNIFRPSFMARSASLPTFRLPLWPQGRGEAYAFRRRKNFVMRQIPSR